MMSNISARQLKQNTFLVISVVILVTQSLTSLVSAAEYDLIETYTIGVRPSGIDYNPDNDSLWVVENRGGGIYEVQKRGEDILGEIRFKSEDLEGIAQNTDKGTLFITEERKRSILEIDKNGKLLKTIKVTMETGEEDANYGFEGVTYDSLTGHLFVANEKNPTAILEITPDGEIENYIDIDAEELADVSLDKKTGNLIVLTQNPNMIIEITKDGTLVDSFELDIPNPQGFTMDNDGFLYVVSDEPQRLYVFSPIM
ncbi:MAG: SdiA-regulated domain-containing protein [Candidatus Brocadiales bacterium]